MVWNYLFSGKTNFNHELLKLIKTKNNDQVESTLKNSKNLCTAVDSTGASLLHYSAGYDNEIITQLLIKLGAKINLQNEKEQTPLMLATKGEHEEVIRILLENNADIYISNKEGISALQMVIQNSHSLPEILEMFLNKMRIDCSSSDSKQIAKEFLKVKCPLYIAVRLRNLEVVKYMISEQIAIDASDPELKQTALHIAVQKRDFLMVKLLIEYGANVNALDVMKHTTLLSIRTFEDTQILKLLVEKGTDVTACTEDGLMQLHWILKSGTSEAVKTILHSGVDFQEKDSHDRTVLHYLANNVNDGIIDVIDDWIGKTNDEENTILFDRILSMFNSTGLKKVQCKFVDWNVKDKDGRSPIHNAMAAGNVKFVDYLLKNGANPNVKSLNGITPFFEALKSISKLVQRVDCVKIIMENGAYPNVELERYFQLYNTKFAIERDLPLLLPVIAHLVLRQVTGEWISEKLFQFIDCHSQLKDCVTIFRKELNQLKKEKIYVSKNNFRVVTMFDLLIETDNKFAFYTNCKIDLIDMISKPHTYYNSILRRRADNVLEESEAVVKYYLKCAGVFIIMTCILFVLFMFYYSCYVCNCFITNETYSSATAALLTLYTAYEIIRYFYKSY